MFFFFFFRNIYNTKRIKKKKKAEKLPRDSKYKQQPMLTFNENQETKARILYVS